MDQRQPTPLTYQIAGIVADLRRTGSGWGPRAALVALIQACLLRIFTRLEALLSLWQAGQLPLPVARPQTAHPHRAEATPHRRTTPRRPRLRVPSKHAAKPHPPRRAQAAQSPTKPIHITPPRDAKPRHRTAFPLDPRPEFPRIQVAASRLFCYDYKTIYEN